MTYDPQQLPPTRSFSSPPAQHPVGPPVSGGAPYHSPPAQPYGQLPAGFHQPPSAKKSNTIKIVDRLRQRHGLMPRTWPDRSAHRRRGDGEDEGGANRDRTDLPSCFGRPVGADRRAGRCGRSPPAGRARAVTVRRARAALDPKRPIRQCSPVTEPDGRDGWFFGLLGYLARDRDT